MGLLDNLILGFSVAVSPVNLMLCLIGALLGTLVGVLPGIGPLTTIALLLPVTFGLSPVGSLIMLAGIFYGAQYGGSTTAILAKMPGEASSIITCLDGYQMAQNGRAGAALTIAALGSFFAGTVATFLVAVASVPLSAAALQFGAAEYFSLMMLGLIGSVVLAQGSLLKAIAMVMLGLLFGLVGTDLESSVQRYTFDFPALSDGIGFIAVGMGLFGIAELIANLERGTVDKEKAGVVGTLRPTPQEGRAAMPAVMRGTALGSLLGVLPGGGATLASFAAYALEKKLSRTPERFGTGMVEGVAGPESANNAAAQTSFIPMLTLGVPSNAIMALMIAAMMLQGLTPGPQILTKQPELFWGLIASMWIGNAMLLVINLPLIGIWVKLLDVPYRLLFPIIIVVSCIGVYGTQNSTFEVWLTLLFGFVGYLLYKLGCEPAPMLLGFVLGPMMEQNLRRALVLSRGDPMTLMQRPVSAVLLGLALVLLLLVILPSFRRTREEAFKEG
jgi:putative tricarboxylic transport membrane protein